MKKLLYLITLLGLLLLTSCINTNSIEKDIHEYRPSYDEEYHYNLCECGEKENIEAHTFTEEVIVEPTCETEGKIKYTCSCGYTKEETVDQQIKRTSIATSGKNAPLKPTDAGAVECKLA